MFIKLFLGICILNSIEAIFLIKLPTEEVDKIHGKLAAEKPHVLLSPNDAAQSPLNLESIENSHHGHVAALEAKNLVDLAESLNLTILVKALEETGLDNIIDHEGKYTLFAPTDEAFKNIPEWAGKIPLKELLKFHVARGLIYSKDITNDLEVRSILAKRDIRLNIYKNGSLVTANGSPIKAVDFEAHNGVLHIIDKVFVHIYERGGTIVKELSRCPAFKFATKLIGIAGMWELLHEKGPFTLFAPTDEAFSKLTPDVVQHLMDNPTLLRQVLLYHVAVGTWYSAGLEDGATLRTEHGAKISVGVGEDFVKINQQAMVTSTDGTASNGVIHGIDTVLMPPALLKKIQKSMKYSGRRHLKGRNGD